MKKKQKKDNSLLHLPVMGTKQPINSIPLSKKVCIAVPTTGTVRVEWMMARSGVIIPIKSGHGDVIQFFDQYSPLNYVVAHARNICVQHSLSNDFEWTFFIDSDTIIPPNMFLKLGEYMRENKYPVISGLYFCKGTYPEPLVFRGRGTGFYGNWKFGDKVEVDGLPLGCTLIHNSILKAMWDESEEYQCQNAKSWLKVRRVFTAPESSWKDPETGRYNSISGTEDLPWCFPPETNVIGNEIKEIKDYKINDLVLTHNGQYKPVTKVFTRKYEGELIEVVSKLNNGIKMTSNHKVLVKRNSDILWIEAKDLLKTDMVAFPKIKNTYYKETLRGEDYLKVEYCDKFNSDSLKEKNIKNLYEEGYSTRQIGNIVNVDQKIVIQKMKEYNIPRRGNSEGKIISRKKEKIVKDLKYIKFKKQGTTSVIPRDIILDETLAELFGFYVAEGWSGKDGISFSFGHHEEKYINRVCEIIKKYFELIPKVSKDRTSTIVTVYGDIIGKLFSLWFGDRALNKRIANFILTNEETIIKGFLKGYWLGDGCFTEKCRDASTVSKQLAYDIKLLLTRINIPSGISFRKRKETAYIEGREIHQHDIYVIYIANSFNKEFSKVIGKEVLNGEEIKSYSVDDNYIWNKIIDIKRSQYDGKVYNLEVKDDNTYLTESFIVHNCERVINDKILEKAGWTDLAKKKYPFIIDTSVFCQHIDQYGIQYPGYNYKNMPQYKGSQLEKDENAGKYMIATTKGSQYEKEKKHGKK